jgi:signal transduction histidine kinase
MRTEDGHDSKVPLEHGASRLMALVIGGALLLLWTLFAWHALSERSDAIEQAFLNEETFGKLYSEYAETLIEFGANPVHVIDEVAETTEDAKTPEQHLLADFRTEFDLHAGITLGLRRVSTRAPDQVTRILDSGVLTVIVPRPIKEMAAVVRWSETGALADWRRQMLLEGGTLALVTLLTAGLGAVLVRQLSRHEREGMVRQRLERQLHHAQRLDSIGRLAGGIAHDLNNTLVPIIALTKLAMRNSSDGDPAREDLALIHQAGVRARELVKQILVFGRKDTGEQQQLDVAEIAKEALSMLRSTIPAMISLVGDIGEVPRISGDPIQIHQVIVNLATNAFHAIGTGSGTISIRVSPANMKDGTGRRAAGVVVSDTGCGMSAETLDHIFEPFFTTKAIGEGTGLGLAVVHGIVMALGGTIEVESEVGRGTTFTLLFPEVSGASEQRSAA